MSVWKDYSKEKPTKIGYYLVERMFVDNGDTKFEVEFFEPQDEYVNKFCKEFNQTVNVKVKTTEPDFRRSRFETIVTRWMEIPK